MLTLTLVMILLVVRTNVNKDESVPEDSKVRRNETDIGFLIKAHFYTCFTERYSVV